MKLTKYIVAILGLGLVSTVHGGVKIIGYANGCAIVRVRSVGFLTPSITEHYHYPTNQPGVLNQGANASNPGFVGMTAGAAGTATSGGLVRPAKVEVRQAADSTAQGGFGVGGAGGIGMGGAGGAGNGHDGNNGNGGNPHFN